jgi:hypothetical protein
MNTKPFEESGTSKATGEQANISERNEIAESEYKENE